MWLNRVSRDCSWITVQPPLYTNYLWGYGMFLMLQSHSQSSPTHRNTRLFGIWSEMLTHIKEFKEFEFGQQITVMWAEETQQHSYNLQASQCLGNFWDNTESWKVIFQTGAITEFDTSWHHWQSRNKVQFGNRLSWSWNFREILNHFILSPC